MSAPLVVTIPMTPPRELSPNARVHWARRAKQAKALRMAAYYAAVGRLADAEGLRAGNAVRAAERIAVGVTVCWERGRRRLDDDNCWASMKNARDGICEALGIDDRRLVIRDLTQDRWTKDDPGGWVRVTLEGEAA